MFVTLFHYSKSGQPTWYFGSDLWPPDLNPPGEVTTFSGPLYEATGPYFGEAFDPSRFGVRRVGTMTLRFTSANAGTISYST